MSDTQSHRVAIVTGSSRGLGRAIALRLAADGVRVTVNCHGSQRDAEAVVAEIEAAGGGAIAVRADVTDSDDVLHLVHETTSRLGPADILVNNAIGPHGGISFENDTWEEHLKQLRFCIKAPLELISAVAPGMRERQWGRIINIGSEAAHMTVGGHTAYVAAKAAMVGLTRNHAMELGPDKITVNIVEPGWIPVERHDDVNDTGKEGYARQTLLKHQGLPTDIANAVAYLASEAAAFVTGQRMVVNGGRTVT